MLTVKQKKRVATGIAGILAAVVIFYFGGVVGSGSWFVSDWGKKEISAPSTDTAEPGAGDIMESDGNLVISDGEELGGVSLFSAILPRAAYAANAISDEADTAAILTATIVPDTATNQQVDWLINYQNADSDFATNNILSDCVTLTPSSDGALTATLVCKKPFGEKIIVTCVSRDNPEAQATCILDYAQKIESVNLSFGDLAVNLGGNTEIIYEVNPNGKGPGGATTVSITKSSVYTLEDDFTYEVYISGKSIVTGEYSALFSLNGSTITTNWAYSESLIDDGLYFDYVHDIINWTITERSGDILFNNLSTSQIVSYFSNITESSMFYTAIEVVGHYSEYSAESLFVCTGYTNQASVEDVIIDDSIIF